ncbi:MAG: hypothetical protein AABW90_01745 [Nanoarchaeota archaeon]
MEKRLIRSGEIYHLIGFYGRINGEFISRKDYLNGLIDFKNNIYDPIGSYERNDEVWHGFIVDIAFNKNIKARANPFGSEEVRIRFKYWNDIGKPLQIEKAKEITERNIFVGPESVLEVKAD